MSDLNLPSTSLHADALGEPVCGMTWGHSGVRGTWTTPAAERSMAAMSDLNLNWVTLAYAAVQATAQSTTIPFREAPSLSDDEVCAVVGRARAQGLKVCLKPMVNVADGTWRAYIGFFDWDVPGEPTWAEWFASYRQYIVHQARLAAELEVDLFCIGCEMVRTDPQESLWRQLIAEVRAVYDGPITYNCDKYQEDHISWWDAVDVISASGYYPSGEWEEQLDRIEAVVERERKPFCFLEAGCPSRDGAAARPNDWTLLGAPNERVQADYLDEMMTAAARRPWVGGFMLWDWPAELYDVAQAARNDDYCIYGKEAAGVVAEHYRRALSSG
ncbi:MAG: 1,4-beta-xylanase [Lapillicoccus sp.]